MFSLSESHKTARTAGGQQGWSIVVNRVQNPEAVREGRRVMEELLIQTLLRQLSDDQSAES